MLQVAVLIRALCTAALAVTTRAWVFPAPSIRAASCITSRIRKAGFTPLQADGSGPSGRGDPSHASVAKAFAPWQGRPSKTLPSIGGEGLRAFARPLTADKWKTLQSRRVQVLVVFSGVNAHMAKSAAKTIKDAWPDVLVTTKEIIPMTRIMCEVLVDGRVVASKRPGQNSLYLNMGAIGAFLQTARRRRRPKNIYGDPDSYNVASKPNVKKTFSELIEPNMGAMYFVETNTKKRKRTALRESVEAMRGGGSGKKNQSKGTGFTGFGQGKGTA